MAPALDVSSSSGPTTGLDPFAVAGRSLDDSSAVVVINATSNRSTADLRLGMAIDVSADANASSTTAKARTISAQSTVRGPLRVVNAGQGELTVLGQTAQIDQNTLLDGFASVGSLKTGDMIEVHGIMQRDLSKVLATRVTLIRDASANQSVEIIGTVSNLSGGQIQLGGTTITNAPSGFSNGERVRVVGTQNGATSVAAMQANATPLPARSTGALVTVEGIVQDALPGAPTRIRIGDLDIDVTSLPGATSTALVVGSRAVIRGTKEATTLRATEARVIAPSDKIAYQLSGGVTDFVSRASFKVRGEAVNASAASFIGGTVTDLAAGKRVRVIGVAGAGALDAVEVTFLTP
jgi:hypothetical protein